MIGDVILYARVGDTLRTSGVIYEVGLVRDGLHVVPIPIRALYKGLSLTSSACEFLSELLGPDSVDKEKKIFLGAD